MPRLAVLAALTFMSLGCSSSAVSRSMGAQCESRSDCDERCLRGADYPGGMCTTSCEIDSDCPDSAQCVDKEGGVCLYSCDQPFDCEFLGSGWKCKDKKSRSDNSVKVNVCFGD